MSQTNEITETIKLIQEMISTNEFMELFNNDKQLYREKITSIFPTFAASYPSLFKKVINKDDLTMLTQMLQSINDIEQGKNEKDITVNIGETLAEKYLYPVLGRPETSTEKQPEFITK